VTSDRDPLWEDIAGHIGRASGEPFVPRRVEHAGGGCINRAVVLEGANRRYFVKLNERERAEMFAAEAEGLAELAAAGAVRVPAVVCHGSARGSAYLVLEHLALTGGDGAVQERLGRGLAQLHRVIRPQFGWSRDNAIGSTPQINTRSGDWVAFYGEHRLRFQLERAAHNGCDHELSRLGERLSAGLGGFFTAYRPLASLLHGDLWGGNQSALADGTPVIFDPAVYYGDREADIAMTELFGGFSRRFYAAYHEAWPLDAGYRVRKQLYKLYHVLNHLNLFGGGYGAQARAMMERLLAELR
jgi:fructosamine-3-kinase